MILVDVNEVGSHLLHVAVEAIKRSSIPESSDVRFELNFERRPGAGGIRSGLHV